MSHKAGIQLVTSAVPSPFVPDCDCPRSQSYAVLPDPEFTLKTLPPQLPRWPLEREPLTHVCEAPARSPRACVFALTPKEMEVLGLLNRGMTYKLIARTLNVGFETVKWHMKNLYSKLSASSRYDALANARLLGLIGG